LSFDHHQKREISRILHNRAGMSLTTNRSSNACEITQVENVPYSNGCGLNVVELIAQYLNEIDLEDFDDKPVKLQHNSERCLQRPLILEY